MSESESKSVLKPLDRSLTNLLSSGQLITSVFSVVKELVENSLDAGATNIHISLISFGVEKITVRDDGCGIEVSDAPYMARPHCTSKLVNYDDLNRLTTYGFRGEGLASVCTVADVKVETIRKGETVGRAYTLDNTGNITNERPCAANKGTVVTVQNLFKNLPVRKQFYSTSVRKEEELRSIKAVLRALAIVNFETRFTLVHNSTPIWTKQSCKNISKSLEDVLGFKVMQQLVFYQDNYSDNASNKFKITTFLPKQNCDHRVVGKQQPDLTYVFVNKRPVKLKEFFKLLKEFYVSANNLTGSLVRYPVCCVLIDVALSSMDVNVDPSKQTIFLHQKEEILRELTSVLIRHYAVQGAVAIRDLDRSIESQNESLVSTPKTTKTVSRVDKSASTSSYSGCDVSTISLESDADLSSTQISVDNGNASISHLSLNSNFDKDDTEPNPHTTLQQNIDEEPVCIHIPLKPNQKIETLAAPPAKRQKTLNEMVTNSKVDNVTAKEAKTSNCTKKLRECATRVLTNCKQRLEEKQLPLDSWVSSQATKQSYVQIEKRVITFSIDTLKQKVSNRLQSSQRNDGICRLIGRYNAFWICKMNNELCIINHHRIHETVLLHSLMQTYKVATRPIQTPKTITETNLGKLEFNTLASLSYAYTPQDSIVSITDERILSNGFNIRKIEPSSQSSSIFQLIALADHLPFFGVGDLKEVLLKIAVDSSVSLYDSRTSAITQYLKDETVRMVRNCPYRLDKKEITDLLESTRKCKSDGECKQCFHGKPFFTKIFDISLKT